MPRVEHSNTRKSRPSAAQTATSPLREASTANLPAQQINNDMAEKANRRKSAHFGNIGVAPGDDAAGPSTTGKNGQGGKRVVSALAVQAGKEGRRLGKRLSAVNPEMIGVSWEQRESKYEEWMKAAIDNKITVTNTWNFALIDYFHDMTLLRNGPDDQSINFQKASSTLDGCVKIWTSRVDSVATETGKLLSGLAGGNGEEVEEDAEGEGEDPDRPKTTRKNTHRSESTLAKSFATLQVKKLDLEFSVDPLFKKTSADFDEGGAMGLLMNHLGVDGRMRVVFDAGDAVVEEEELEEELGPGMEVEVNLENLRQFIPSPETTENLLISDTLSSFRFSSDPSAIPDLTSIFGLKDSWEAEDDGGMSDFGGSAGGNGPVDFFGDDDFSGGGGMGGGGYDDNGSDGGGDYPVGGGMTMAASGSGAIGLGQPGDHLMPFDPKRGGGGELVMALTGKDGEGEEDGMFDYFDKAFGKRGWAGVEHWKLRKVAKKDPAATATKKDKAAGAGRAPFVLDFTSPLPTASSSKVLFAPASRTSIALPSQASSSRTKRSSKDKNDLADKYKKRRREKERQKEESANLLPDDMHFSSRQLVRLFMKPQFALRIRKRASNARIENAEGEIDTTFWADAAAERAGGFDDSSTPMPFESQFFNDGDNDGDDDIGDFAFVDDTLDDSVNALPSGLGGNDGEDGEENLWQGSQTQIKRARPENVAFAKRAKRVDVKRLKDDIWVGLKSLVPKPVNGDEIEVDDPETETEELTPVGEAKTFSNIITDLRRTYPKDKMSEISTSFCFICLLHLANEEGLTLEAARFDGLEGEDVGCQGVVELDMPGVGDEGSMPQQKRRKIKGNPGGDGGERVVGELQALRVYKDPTAGRAA